MIDESKAAFLKQQTRGSILRYIYGREEVSKQQVARELSLSMPTALRHIKELMEESLIREAGQYASTGGRKASILTGVPMARAALGADITANHVSLVLTDLYGDTVRHTRISRGFSAGADYWVKLYEDIGSFLIRAGMDAPRLLGIGVSVPGIVDRENRIITHSHALGIYSYPCDLIRESLHSPCLVLNDANAAALAEVYPAAHTGSMVYLSLSNSVGGAVYIGGRLFTGDDQRAGEFGHMCLVPKGETCYCGKQGCADAYLSALRLSEPYGGHLDAFFEALRRKDPKAMELFEPYLSALAILVSSLRMAFDCTIILGGYVGGYLMPYLARLRALSAAHDPFQADAAYLQPCHFHYEASALGAALQYINRFIAAS